ncbi:M23 family metallopeptidase [Hyphococcus sp.]|uniref:M23 family metallopeptidase n=1 Tax=Hyphococcus sp. TaxID=2038636 RepID=UPI0035C70E86
MLKSLFVTSSFLIFCGIANAQDEWVYPVGVSEKRPTPESGNDNGYVITQHYRYVDNQHTGVDLSNGFEGGEVRAVADGVIANKCETDDFEKSDPNVCGGFGNAIIIEHEIGFYSLYAHMKHDSLTTKDVGADVVVGEKIGEVNCTGETYGNSECGNGRRGSHLHFAIKTTDDFGCGYLKSVKCKSEAEYEDNFEIYRSPLYTIDLYRADTVLPVSIDFNSLPDDTPTDTLPALTQVAENYQSLGVSFRSREDSSPRFTIPGERHTNGTIAVIDSDRPRALSGSTFNIVAEFEFPAIEVSAEVFAPIGRRVTMTAKGPDEEVLAVVQTSWLTAWLGWKRRLSVKDVGPIFSVEWEATPDPSTATVTIDDLIIVENFIPLPL